MPNNCPRCKGFVFTDGGEATACAICGWYDAVEDNGNPVYRQSQMSSTPRTGSRVKKGWQGRINEEKKEKA